MDYQKALELIEKAERIDLEGGEEEKCRRALSECDEALTHLFKLVGGECKLTDSEEEFKKIINLQKRQLETLAIRSLEMQEENRKLVELIENPSSPRLEPMSPASPSSPMSPSSPKAIIQQAVQEAQLLQQLAQRSANFEKSSQSSLQSLQLSVPSRSGFEAKTLQHEISQETKRLIEIAQRSATLKNSTVRSASTGTATDLVFGLSEQPATNLMSAVRTPSSDPITTPKSLTRTLDVGTSIRVSPASFVSPLPPSAKSNYRSLPRSPAPPTPTRYSQRSDSASPQRIIISPEDVPSKPIPPSISEIPLPAVPQLSIGRDRSGSPFVSPPLSDVTKEGTQDYLFSLAEAQSVLNGVQYPRPLSPSVPFCGDADPLLAPPRRVHFPVPPPVALDENKPRAIAVYSQDASLRTASARADPISSKKYPMMSPKDDSRHRSRTASTSLTHRRTLSPLVAHAQTTASDLVNNVKQLSPAPDGSSPRRIFRNIKALSPAMTVSTETIMSERELTVITSPQRIPDGFTLLKRLSESSVSSSAGTTPVSTPVRSPQQVATTSPIRSPLQSTSSPVWKSPTPVRSPLQSTSSPVWRSPTPVRSPQQVASTSPIRKSSTSVKSPSHVAGTSPIQTNTPSPVQRSPTPVRSPQQVATTSPIRKSSTSVRSSSQVASTSPIRKSSPASGLMSPMRIESPSLDSEPPTNSPSPRLAEILNSQPSCEPSPPADKSDTESEPEPELEPVQQLQEDEPVPVSPDQTIIDSKPLQYTPPSEVYVSSPAQPVRQSPVVLDTPHTKYRDVTSENSYGFGTRYFEINPIINSQEKLDTKVENSREEDIKRSVSESPMVEDVAMPPHQLRPMGMSVREWVWASVVVSTAAWVSSASCSCVV